jgi:hypothetical protein
VPLLLDPLLLDPLPTDTDEPAPEPPGEIVVLPLTLPLPAVTVLELLVAPSPRWRVTTRHGLPLTTVVPSELDDMETLPASAGAAAARKPTRTAKAARAVRMSTLRNLCRANPRAQSAHRTAAYPI